MEAAAARKETPLPFQPALSVRWPAGRPMVTTMFLAMVVEECTMMKVLYIFFPCSLHLLARSVLSDMARLKLKFILLLVF
jgi:hypothetical protein